MRWYSAFDVVDLEVENTSRRIVDRRSLHEEDREIVLVADRGGRRFRHLELHFQVEILYIPVSGGAAIPHEERQVIESC